jgi:hypothetical protein
MGSVWGDSGGGPPGVGPAGEPAPIEVELVADEALPADGPDAAASALETIRGKGGRSGIARLPRALKLAGALAAAAALVVAVWPTPARRQAAPRPVPTPSQMDAGLSEVRLAGTTVRTDDGAGHAVLELKLANDAPTRLSVDTVELWDAAGTRIGYTAQWPAGEVGPDSVVFVPVTLSYACDGYGQAPVLPLSIRYSVSPPQDPNIRHDYSLPVVGGNWDTFVNGQAAHCGGGTNSVFVSAIDTAQTRKDPNVDPAGRYSFDLTFTFQAVGTAPWSLDSIGPAPRGFTITTADLPLALGPGQSGSITTHWRIAGCAPPPEWGSEGTWLEIRTRMSGSAPGGVGPVSDQVSEVVLRSELLTKMVRIACGG